MKGKNGSNGENGFRSLLNHRILTKEEEMALVSSLNEEPDNREVWEKLFFSNLRLVASIVDQEKYRGCGLALEDLREEGLAGLIAAINKAKAEKMKKSRLASYASWWIRQAIQKAIGKQGHIVDRPQRDFAKALRFARKNGGARDIEIKGKGKEIFSRMLNPPFSLNQKAREREERDYGDFPAELIETIPDARDNPEELMIKKDWQSKLEKALEELFLQRLDKREIFIIKERRGLEDDEPKSLQNVASILNISKERVRQIQIKAEKKLGKRAFLFQAKIQ